jgi:hypothetical protein
MEGGIGGRCQEKNRRWIWCKQCIHKFVHVKMTAVETVLGIRGGRVEERSRGGNSSMIYLIHCKNLCICYNVPTPSTIIKKWLHRCVWLLRKIKWKGILKLDKVESGMRCNIFKYNNKTD